MNIRKCVANAILEYLSNMDYQSIVKDFAERTKTKFGIELSLHYSPLSNTIILSKIVVPKSNRNSGVGSAAMKEICTFADQYRTRIALTPSSDFGGNKSKLINFYKSFNFEKNNDHEVSEAMIRYPA